MELQDSLLPKEIVKQLDKYIIGQCEAKKAISIAIRNRYRRMQLTDELREEVLPKNILMIGPTGVGKTEIARRMAMILNAPFVKVEATKFTEIGYVGRNVESMVRDLAAEAVRLVRKKKEEEILKTAEKLAENRIIDVLMKKNSAKTAPEKTDAQKLKQQTTIDISEFEFVNNIENDFREKLQSGKLNNDYIEIEIAPSLDAMSSVGVISATSDLEEINMNIKEMIDNVFSKKNKKEISVT